MNLPKRTITLFLGACALGYPLLSSAHPLTLSEAEGIAIARSSLLKRIQAKQVAMEETSVASGQLKDPRLMVGAMNLPTNSFNISQEPMTQLQVGASQSFPRGRTLHYRSLQKHQIAQAFYQKSFVLRASIRRAVRISWLNLYYWLHAKRIVNRQKGVFRHLLKVTESLLANNKAQQMDAVRAQLEVFELDNKLIIIDKQIEGARAELGRWIGVGQAKSARPRRLPHWKKAPTLAKMRKIIKHHPEIKVDISLISASYSGIKTAKQQYWPGFNLTASYGFRSGKNLDGKRRSDFLTALVSMDVPIFHKNRQDRTLNASVEKMAIAQENKEIHFRQLTRVLEAQYTAWKELRQSEWLYRRHLIPKAAQYAKATLVSYQNNQTDFPTLARAYVRDYETQLLGLRAKIDRDISRANLFYLQGK